MGGLIGTRQVMSQLGLIRREFGLGCATRCVGAILRCRRTTFLDVAFDTASKARKSKRLAKRAHHAP
jgi:hypothetical protein